MRGISTIADTAAAAAADSSPGSVWREGPAGGGEVSSELELELELWSEAAGNSQGKKVENKETVGTRSYTPDN
jgi:hypothetical protein